MAYAAITVEGGFLPADLLDRIATGKGAGQAAADFGVEGRLSDAMQSAFSDARAYWEAFTRRQAASRESATTLTRQAWITPLLETLGFPPLEFQRAAIPAGGDAFTISHLAGDDPNAPPVHIVGFDQSLERRESGRRSPHALVQEYLNRSDALWGIVTNGTKLRLLRDSTRIAHPVFIEFDLQGMIEGNLYSEFVLLYRLLHGSRFPRGAEDAAECILERHYQEGIDVGGRVREKLRDGVEKALNELGSGFLDHPESSALRERLVSGTLTEAAFYRQLLRLVYRLLFLFVTEERRLLFSPRGTAEEGDRRAIYDRYYSVSRLRERIERPFADDPFSDLWPGLRATFGLFRHADQAAQFGLTALNGELFGVAACSDLEEASCDNVHLLRAIYRLSTFLDEGEQGRGRRRRQNRRAIKRRVNYAGLDVEELGSVYESLLDLRPAVDLDGERRFQLVESGERKQTGSYYTPSSLVHELIESALAPVLQDRLAQAKSTADQERAILGMTVCDPAAGSGHFLLAAVRRMGRELAKVRTGEAEPTPADFRLAERDVIRSCIYAVDKNPLAVDLCKVALWIEGHSTGLPLGFLDHHVKCGDSLVGVFDLDVLRKGIPDDAYTPVTGDDHAVTRAVKEANRRRKFGGQLPLGQAEIDNTADPLAAQAGELRTLAEMPEQTPGDVHAKEGLYRALREEGTTWWQYRTACTLWTAAFFAPLVNLDSGGARRWLVPTSDDVLLALDQPRSLHGQVVGGATAIAERVGFFHWPLEFPDAFAVGGFDVVLGNPPWDVIQPEEKKWFKGRDDAIANSTGARRKELISKLPETDPPLAELWAQHVSIIQQVSKFVRSSGRFTLTGRGDLNTYSLFSELATQTLGAEKRAGILVPTGIATDDSNKSFFAWLVDNRRLVSLFDFENRENLFYGVGHGRFRFSLLTIAGERQDRESFLIAFFLTQPEQLLDRGRVFSLTRADIELFNPNTHTCPTFRSSRDLDITKQIYRTASVLVREGPQEINPWRVAMRQGLFNMTSASHLFRTRAELEASGHTLGADGRFRGPDDAWERLYEAKMIHQFDHRYGDYSDHPDGAETTHLPDVPVERLIEPEYAVRPRYWVRESEIADAVHGSVWAHKWFLGFRDIVRSTDERTVIFSVLPRVGVNHKTPLIFVGQEPRYAAAFLANMNAFVLDFAARQKVGGTSLGFFIVKQLPVLPPGIYTDELLDLIVPRVLELVYTAWDLEPFARDLGYDGQPLTWDVERRAQLRADLDGIYAHLYRLSRDDFAYILDQFPIVQRNDEAAFGEYRTKRLCLEAFDRFAAGFDSGRFDVAQPSESVHAVPAL